MLPIGNRPILWHIMKIYAHYGFKEFILCLGYKGDLIKDYFRNYQWHTCDSTVSLGAKKQVTFHAPHDEEDWTVTLAHTGENSMTAYRIFKIQQYLGNDSNFLLTYGDGVGNIDIPALIRQHESSQNICTLTGVHPPGRFGELGLSGTLVREFNEKPQSEGGYINGGFMVCRREIFNYMSDDPSVMLEHAPIRRIAAESRLGAYLHEGFWQPMDTFQEFNLLNNLWDSGKAPWKIW